MTKSAKFATATVDETTDILALVAAMVPGAHVDDMICVTMELGSWYGDPAVRDLKVSATYMGIPILLREEMGWRVSMD
jgi:hypothetical protein